VTTATEKGNLKKSKNDTIWTGVGSDSNVRCINETKYLHVWTALRLNSLHMLFVIQGENKVFPWLQTFITRKLRGIQTYFFNIT